MQAVATWRKNHEFLLEDGRAHSVVVDLPPEGGGTSAGTTPSELTVLALAGSIASTFIAVARKRHLDCAGLTVVLEGDPLTPSPSPGSIHGSVRLRTHSDRTEADATLKTALEVCPVAQLFRAAAIPVEVAVVVVPLSRGT